MQRKSERNESHRELVLGHGLPDSFGGSLALFHHGLEQHVCEFESDRGYNEQPE